MKPPLLSRPAQLKRSLALRERSSILAPVCAALVMWLMVVSIDTSTSRMTWVHLLCLPVVAMAAFRGGRNLSLVYASLFATAFAGELIWRLRSDGFGAASLEIIATIALAYMLAYVFGNIAGAFQDRGKLSADLRENEALLARASDFRGLASVIRHLAAEIVDAEQVILLLRNPVDEDWEAVTEEEVINLSGVDDTSPQQLTLAAWLMEQQAPLILNRLPDDPRFVVTGELSSVLAQPLRQAAGELIGTLVLVNKRHGPFLPADLRALDRLVGRAETALQHAGLYLRSDEAVARLASQLAAIQLTARKLNAAPTLAHIVQRTLDCVMEVTGGDAGVVVASITGMPIIHRTHRVEVDSEAATALLTGGARLRFPGAESPAIGTPALLVKRASRLQASIRRGGDVRGTIIVESERPDAFSAQDALAIAALADHAAIALENQRLFAEIQQERRKADQVIHDMGDGLMVLDRQTRVVALNPAAQALIGRSGIAAGQPVCEILCGEGDPECRTGCELFVALNKREKAQLPRWTPLHSRDVRRTYAVSLAPMPEGSVALFRDVTAQEDLDRFQRELVATFSHELRAPLANISALVALLQERGEKSELLGLVEAQSERLARLAARTLDVSRLDAGDWQLERRPVPASMLAQQAAGRQGGESPHRAIRLALATPPAWVWADENAAGIVLDNLLDNALKYSPADSAITLRVDPGPDGTVVFAVQDLGPGIAREHHTRIFDRFYRADSSDTRRVYGYGLGLYITRRLVQAMGGRIWLESEPGRGAQFYFTLPAWHSERHTSVDTATEMVDAAP